MILALIAALCVPAPSPFDLDSEVLDALRADWARLERSELADNPYRDKQRFVSQLDELEAFRSAKAPERARAAKAVARWARGEKDDGALWRAHELRARLLVEHAPKDARDALDEALEAYPKVSYPAPAKHSSYQHLVNGRASAALRVDGAEAACEAIVARLGDERFVHFYAEGLEPAFIAAGATEELAGLYLRVAEHFEGTDGALARELRARRLPDVRTIDGDPRRTYVVIGADVETDAARPLVLVLPGGNGQALEFLPWVQRLAEPLTDRFLFAVLSAPVWSEEQTSKVVWVTSQWADGFGATFTVEDFADEVVLALADDADGAPLLFAWSSGGPAAYAAVLRESSPFGGAYVLSSVFKPKPLDLARAKGKRFFLEQGRTDRITPFRFAEEAAETLAENGAETKLVPFEGGHGFAMPDAATSLATALAWLAGDTPKDGR